MFRAKNGHNGNTLKLLAALFMVTDHMAMAFFPQYSLHGVPLAPLQLSSAVYCVFRSLGRISMPIFAFFIAEGCRHTHSMSRYIGRLAGFALLSEIPFQLIETAALRPALSNIFVTLTLGALSCAGYTLFRDKKKPGILNRWAAFLPFLLCLAIAYLLKCDYGIWGVMLIFAAYWPPTRNSRITALAIVLFGINVIDPLWNDTAFVLPSLTHIIYNLSLWFCSLYSLHLIYEYNGERGPKTQTWFYYFYPAHLLLFFFMKLALGLV